MAGPSSSTMSIQTLLFLTTLSLVSALPASPTTPDGNPGVLVDPSDNQPQSTSTSSSNSYNNKGQAAAGLIGALLLLAVVGDLFYLFHRRTRPGRNANGDVNGEQDGKKRWPMPRLGMGKLVRKENGKGEEWKKGKWEELN